jgi:hypothetical protein
MFVSFLLKDETKRQKTAYKLITKYTARAKVENILL